MTYPLDRPVWNAFAGRQARFALREGAALRVDPEVGIFAASSDLARERFSDLSGLADADGIALVEVEGVELLLPDSLQMLWQAACHQMVMDRLASRPPEFDFVELSSEDAPEMLALATLTEPGPFRTRTHELGCFIGVKRGGRLVAMAGERMQPEGFTEVSGVCTHPDHRGHGYAAGLMHVVADRVLGRGETPFLHAYSSNAGVIALYERLGYRLRRVMTLTVVTPAG